MPLGVGDPERWQDSQTRPSPANDRALPTTGAGALPPQLPTGDRIAGTSPAPPGDRGSNVIGAEEGGGAPSTATGNCIGPVVFELGLPQPAVGVPLPAATPSSRRTQVLRNPGGQAANGAQTQLWRNETTWTTGAVIVPILIYGPSKHSV